MANLLIVDDEYYAREGVARAIDWASIGIASVYEAEEVDGAKEIVKAHPIDIIICDIEMSRENGIHFISWLKEQAYDAKLIFLTAYEKFEYAQNALKLGAYDFLIKPAEHVIILNILFS